MSVIWALPRPAYWPHDFILHLQCVMIIMYMRGYFESGIEYAMKCEYSLFPTRPFTKTCSRTLHVCVANWHCGLMCLSLGNNNNNIVDGALLDIQAYT